MASTAPNDHFVRCNQCHDPSQHYSHDIRHRIMTKTTALLPPFIEKVRDLCCVFVRVFLCIHSTFRFLKMFIFAGVKAILLPPDYSEYYATPITSTEFAHLIACYFLLIFCSARGLVRTFDCIVVLGACDHVWRVEPVLPLLHHLDALSQQGAIY